jgi:hypothetical protein
MLNLIQDSRNSLGGMSIVPALVEGFPSFRLNPVLGSMWVEACETVQGTLQQIFTNFVRDEGSLSNKIGMSVLFRCSKLVPVSINYMYYR